jgi:hypothetical protein
MNAKEIASMVNGGTNVSVRGGGVGSSEDKILPLMYQDQFDPEVRWICDYDEEKNITSVFIGHGDRYVYYLPDLDAVLDQEKMLVDKCWVRCAKPKINIVQNAPSSAPKNRKEKRDKERSEKKAAEKAKKEERKKLEHEKIVKNQVEKLNSLKKNGDSLKKNEDSLEKNGDSLEKNGDSENSDSDNSNSE